MITPNGTFEGDCRIVDGTIQNIVKGGGLELTEDEYFVDGTGLHLLPGIIDPQVHFRDPGQPEKETLRSGSAAAASGGVTSFLDMPNNNPSIITLELMQKKLQKAKENCVTNYGFFFGATPDNLSELQSVVGIPNNPVAIPGICGIKIFMGSSTGDLLVHKNEALERIFAQTAGLIAVHAEDEKRLRERKSQFSERTDMGAHAEWRDSETALIATKLAVELAKKYNHRLHILHLTSGLEADWLKGQTDEMITTETLPQHLTFSEVDVLNLGTKLKMNPPIRFSEDRERLWAALLDGTIKCIATDHAPHTIDQKELGWPDAPSGMPGVETSLAVMLTHANDGHCTIEEVVNWMSTNVADCYGMLGKGRLEEGADGDVILVDMTESVEVKDENCWTKVGWNPFVGRNLVGWTQLTVISGVPVFVRSSTTGQKGMFLVQPGETGEALIMMPWD